MVEKKDIEKLIIQNKKSTLKNHWNDAFFYNTTKYSGEIKPNELLIWRSSHFLRGAYPIFRLTFDLNGKLNGIKTEKNPYYKLLNKVSIVFLILLNLVLIFTTEFKPAVIGIIGISLLGFFFYLFFFNVTKYETKILTEELKEAIENIELINNPELTNKPRSESKQEKIKEWTFTKILTRLLLYPFCFFILWLSITGFLDEGMTLHRIFGIIIVLTYIIVDITLTIRKNKNYS
ncbi:hypothetical protein LRR18_16110 [Mangrovimonas sp. AS39]|uniref:DUF443 family protein n=1 Tax=Aestuariibaculum lutulentum TaxID=2920935 RepID=A0ABS9RMD8_9FLAO|nr:MULTISPECIES: hypothetical protein [Flavobacteriaceae]MCF1193114.1 hypothetical protein [Mangrovimonas futianensis]MCF1196809.1 hypothetical protein [Mangrovimonas futianensis]MCH4554120.1 hypothetical protein [Aestuariibaculum lutulentum]